MLTWTIMAIIAAAVLAVVVLRYEHGVWDFVVRFRTWIIVLIGAALDLLPDFLSTLNQDPDFAAIVPEGYRHYVAVAALVLALWSRWRPASRASDPGIKVENALKDAESTAVVTVSHPEEGTAHTVAVVEPKG